MNQSILPFEFESKQVRVIERDGEPWFVGKGVLSVQTPGGNQDMLSARSI